MKSVNKNYFKSLLETPKSHSLLEKTNVYKDIAANLNPNPNLNPNSNHVVIFIGGSCPNTTL